MKKLISKVSALLRNDHADAKFDSSVQIVISFVIGALILTILITVFGTTIRSWITSTTASWFNASGIVRPS